MLRNVFVKPSAEPNAVRAMPRRENEERNSTFNDLKNNANYARIHLSGAVPRGRGHHGVPSVDEGLRESRGVRRPQDLESRPQGVGGACRRRPIPTCRSTCVLRTCRNCAISSKIPKPPTTTSFVAYTMLLNQCRRGRRRTAHLPGHGYGDLYRPQGRGRLYGRRRRRAYRARRLRDLQGAQPALFAGGSLHDDRREELGHEPSGADRHLRRPPRHGVRVPLHHQGRRFGQQDLPLPADQGAAQRGDAHRSSSNRTSRTWARRPARPTIWRSASAERRPKCASRP